MSLDTDHNPWEKNGTAKAIAPSPNAGNAGPKAAGGSDLNIRRILAVWPFALLGALLGLGVAWLVLRYAVPLYQASMRLSVKEDISTTAAMPTATFNIRDPFNDKVDMIKSPTVSSLVVEKLNLHHSAISKGQLKNKDLYGVLSWKTWRDKTVPRPFSFNIRMTNKRGTFTWQRGNRSGTAYWNQPFLMGEDSVVVHANGRFAPDAEIICTRHDIWSLSRQTASRIKLGTQPQSYTMDVSYTDEVPQRAVDILANLTDAYDHTTIDYKNKSLQQSIRFIQERLGPLSEELDSLESSIVEFKRSRKTYTTSGMGNNFLEKTNILDQQLATLNLQQEILNLVQRYVNDPQTKDENLSLVGLQDGYLQSLVISFQQKRQERDKMAAATTLENPNRILVEQELAQMKENIDIQINNYRTILNLQGRNLANQLQAAYDKMQSAPADEKELLEKQRQQNIKQSLYLLLLQRKEEAAITLASTTSETRVLSPPGAGGPISPKSEQMYLIGLALGLIIPVAFSFIRELMNHSVTSKKVIHSNTSAPVIGMVDLAELDSEKLYVIGQGDRSAVAEQIRSIRANLSFYKQPSRPFYIMINSSFSGEGKTFISGNLAKTYALQELKVALLEFDMRKPKLIRKLGKNPKSGLSGVLLGNERIEDIIIPDTESPNLHLFPTGIIPPNPSELMSGRYMPGLKQFLDANYDVIIMDTPPMGLVSDAQLLASWADVTLMVIRFGITPKEQLPEIDEWYRNQTLGRLAIVFNGVKTAGYFGYKYSPYYYKRKYGYEYYHSPKKKKGFLAKLKGAR